MNEKFNKEGRVVVVNPRCPIPLIQKNIMRNEQNNIFKTPALPVAKSKAPYRNGNR